MQTGKSTARTRHTLKTRWGALTALSVLVCLLLAAAAVGPVSHAMAAGPVARAVLFYSPACPHCHVLIRDDLPPIMDRYGDRLRIIAIDASAPAGAKLFQAAVTKFDVPADRQGVPALVIGDQFLTGTTDISERLPTLVTLGLSKGGVAWPAVPGLQTALSAPGALLTSSPSRLLEAVNPPAGVLDRLARDRWANTAALIVLGAMVIAVGRVIWRLIGSWRSRSTAWSLIDAAARPDSGPRSSAALVLILLGLAISGYLTYVTATDSAVLCGPLGSCNLVQQSTYSRLFGVVPVAYLGLIGYIAIAAAFSVSRLSSGRTATGAAFAVFLLALCGTLFSIYLTVLEPFLIGATCVWCLSSAIVMTLLLVVSANGSVTGEPAKAGQPAGGTAS